MALSSQMARAGMGRRHMTSRRRRSRWRWMALIAVVATMTYWFWPQGSAPSSDTAERPADPTIAHDTTAVQPSPSDTQFQTDHDNGHANHTDPLVTSLDTPQPENLRTLHERIADRDDISQEDDSVALVVATESTPTPSADESLSSLPRAPHETAVVTSGPLALGLQLIEQNQLLEARRILNGLLLDPKVNESTAHTLRRNLAQINETLVFSSRIIPGDTLVEAYTIRNGDLLSTIAPVYDIPYQLIEFVNGIRARRIRVGQTFKMIKGPFHAVVDKSNYRMDLFLIESESDQLFYVRSFKVGLGQDNSTPEGRWIVRRSGKVSNPGWTNPRSGQVYAPNDPKNPIGEYWIGLKGEDEHTRELVGYGIHGTIDPDSVGQQVSMGCVRLRPKDIAMVYRLMTSGQSTIEVRQ